MAQDSALEAAVIRPPRIVRLPGEQEHRIPSRDYVPLLEECVADAPPSRLEQGPSGLGVLWCQEKRFERIRTGADGSNERSCGG